MIDFGAFDFECHDWTYPVCWGMKWHSQRGDGVDYVTDVPPWANSDKLAELLLVRLAVLSKQLGVKYWYAHNLSNYDGLFLSAAACRLGWEQSAIIAGASSRVIEWTFRSGETKCVCRDSFAIVDSALEAAAKDFELPIGKSLQKADYQVSPRDWDSAKRKQGCLDDCEVIMQLLPKLETYVQEWKGQMKATFSSIALSIIKGNLPEPLPTIPERHNITAQRANYGSRVEVFRHMPEFRMSEYDINSSYPCAMTATLPWEPLVTIDNPQGARRALDNGEEGVFRCLVDVPDTDLPPLPYKLPCDDCLRRETTEYCVHERSSAVYFPSGTWEAWFPANELRYALSQGVDVQPLQCEIYSAKQPFATFINQVYALKANAKGALRETTKKILNGGWGKFGQRPDQQSLIAFASVDELHTAIWTEPGRYTRLGKQSATVSSFRWPKHTNFAVASYILGGARIALHKDLRHSRLPAYCDADAVHCELDAFKKSARIGNALGQLKECVRDFQGEYYAPKLYRLRLSDGSVQFANKGFQIRCHACRYRTGERCTCDDNFSRVVMGEGSSKSRMRLIKSQLRQHPTKVARREDTKSWKGYSTKRYSYADGNTRPWRVEELIALSHRKQKSPWATEKTRA